MAEWIRDMFVSMMRIVLHKYYRTNNYERYLVPIGNIAGRNCQVPLAVTEELDEFEVGGETTDAVVTGSTSTENTRAATTPVQPMDIDFNMSKFPVTEDRNNHVIPDILPSLNTVDIPDVSEPQSWHNELPQVCLEITVIF